MSTLSVLYQDDDLIAIAKPPGLLVHRSPIDRHETRFAMQMLRDQVGRHVYPVHRLDKPTAGVLLFAFSSEMARAMGEQMMEKAFSKTYLAIVRGFVHHSGIIDYALRYKADKIADRHRIRPVAPQPAVSAYQSLARFELPFASGRYASSRYSLVRLEPVTGRKHQLRRHMVHLRHPIVGDTTHGDGKQNKFIRETFNFSNLALSCTRMGFYHPLSDKWTTITAPAHAQMTGLLDRWQAYKVA
ncbi:pseudouridine synthase [Alteromonas halophila]|uniref:tRNA pseudouridine synthase C n=1 Tax=Alteromonas halophila TaxID=516698 RepID=A0A918JBM9_9ALTE|nr:pseudouridine synthase [Alteromonas halophila]GGW73133.1 tRNA pseudouridine(65) synthase TruC [Alteromonas halophila]